MPKERSHWHLARRIGAQLTSGPLADAVLGYPELVFAGAVAHDGAYYVLGDPSAQAHADRVHGATGADSFEPFRRLALEAPALGTAGLAFGLGALTHLAADVTFHPLVFSWTGDAGAGDPELRSGWLYRHQACETALDLHLEALWGPAPVRRYSSLVRKAGRDLGRAYTTWAGTDARPWIEAHGRLQGLFDNGLVAWAARALSWNRRGEDGDLSAAFYRGRPVRHPAFEGPLEWVDPVTGEPGRASLEDLVVRFEGLALALAAEWETAWTAGAVPFADRVGPTLDTGLPWAPDRTKKHFRPQWF